MQKLKPGDKDRIVLVRNEKHKHLIGQVVTIRVGHHDDDEVIGELNGEISIFKEYQLEKISDYG